MLTRFRSSNAMLRVDFPPEQFGMGQDVEGNPAPYPAVKFNMGVAEVESQRLAELMRKHPANESNGHLGQGTFWEETHASEQRVLESLLAKGNIEITARMPEGGLTLIDREMIDSMARTSKHIAPTQGAITVDRINKAIDRFKITGISRAEQTLSIPRIRARLVEVLGALEDAGIIKEAKLDASWTGDSGGDTGADR